MSNGLPPLPGVYYACVVNGEEVRMYSPEQMSEYAIAAIRQTWLEAERLCLDRMEASGEMAGRAKDKEARIHWSAAATDSKCCADRMRAALQALERLEQSA